MDFRLRGGLVPHLGRFLGAVAALPRNFKSVGNMARRDASSESNSIGRQRVIFASRGAKTILNFWTVFRA